MQDLFIDVLISNRIFTKRKGKDSVKIVLLILLVCSQFFIFSQNKVFAKVEFSPQSEDIVNKNFEVKLIDSIKIRAYYTNIVNNIISSGHTIVNLDSIEIRNDTCIGRIFVSKKYQIGQIFFAEEYKSILEASGIQRNRLEEKSLSQVGLTKYLNLLVNQKTNYGFPFAKAKLDSTYFIDNQLFANLVIDKGRFFVFDSIKMEGNINLGMNFVQKFLDIKPGDYYSHEKVLRSNKRIGELQYVKKIKEPFVRFINDKASLVLTCDAKPASRFDFLIGFLPSTAADGSRSLNISGDITAELNNAFNQGEFIYFMGKRLKPENLELQIKTTIPYIVGLPVGTHLDFRIFKNSIQNIDLYFDGGLQYLFGGFNNLKIYGSFRSSRLLEINTNQILTSGKLPERLDVTYSGVGLGINIRQLDYRFNPSRGYTFETNLVIGNKKILPNIQILQLSGFENSYDILKLNSLQSDLDVNFSHYSPLKDWATIKLGGSFGLRYNQQKIRENELMRIGGNKLLRGFDEESILTNFYSIATFEFRFLFDENSYLSLPFFDFGWTRVLQNGEYVYDNVMGLGMGMNFGTAAGIFNLSLAAGKTRATSFDFGRMKVHFGYVNLF
jgi:outer membrane protein assembly factor BamA